MSSVVIRCKKCLAGLNELNETGRCVSSNVYNLCNTKKQVKNHHIRIHSVAPALYPERCVNGHEYAFISTLCSTAAQDAHAATRVSELERLLLEKDKELTTHTILLNYYRKGT
jgi:hypothetical protein